MNIIKNKFVSIFNKNLFRSEEKNLFARNCVDKWKWKLNKIICPLLMAFLSLSLSVYTFLQEGVEQGFWNFVKILGFHSKTISDITLPPHCAKFGRTKGWIFNICPRIPKLLVWLLTGWKVCCIHMSQHKICSG